MNYETASSLLAYDPFSGALFWRNDMSNAVKGITVAGCINITGYRHVIVKGKCYKSHRLAWLLYYGEWPKGQIDHLNGERDDNRISNLRDCSPKENQRNRPCHREGTLWGTTKIHGGKFYQARVHGVYLGNFKTQEQAHIRAIEYSKTLSGGN